MIALLVDRVVRSQRWLDPTGVFIQKVVGGIYKPLGGAGQSIKSFLHGTWLGHALHPVLTDVPLGAWTVAIAADLVSYSGKLKPEVGDFCVLIGVVAAYGALVTGYNDHHETYGHELRLATAHGLLMTLTTVLYTASLVLRWLGGGSAHDLAVIVAVIGYVLLVSAAYLGGDLVFGTGTMVNRNAFIDGPEEHFVRVGKPQDFVEGQMRKIDAAGMDVLVVRYAGQLYAISNTCSHAGGPLDEGELDKTRVTCPWHASRFDAVNGQVTRGPATYSQPTLKVRESGDAVEVMLSRSLHE